MDILIYQFSYLAIIVGGIIILAFILYRKVRARFNILYAFINISMIIWATRRFALLIVENYE